MTPSWRSVLAILWIVQFLVTMATTLGLTFVPFFLEKDPILAVTSNEERLFYTSLILAGPFFTTLIATPFWGWMGDRTGHKKQVLRAIIGLGITQLLMGFATSPLQLVLIRMVQGMVSGVVAANLGMLSAMTPPEHQGRAISILQSSNMVGLVLGPMIGGGLAYALGFRPVYWLIGSVILLTALLSWWWLPASEKRKEIETKTDKEKKKIDKEADDQHRASNPFVALWEAMREGWRNLPLRMSFGILVLGNFAWTLSQAVFAIYVGKLIVQAVATGQVSASWWTEDLVFSSICMSITGVMSFVMSFWWGRLHDEGKRWLLPFASLMIAVGSLLLAFWPPWGWVLFARLVMGGGLSGLSSLPYAVISSHVSVAERSKYMGLGTSMIHLGNLGGFLLGGVLARLWGESANFSMTAVICIGMIVLARQVSVDKQHTPLSSHP